MPRLALVCLIGVAAALLLPASVLAAANPAADLAYEEGARALREGDVDAALGALAEAERLAPDDPDTLALYARALLIAGRPQQSFERLQRLQVIDPDAPDLVYFRGLARYRTDDWPGAREDLRAALEERPDDDDAAVLHLLLGVVAHNLGDLPEARNELSQAEGLDPTLEAQVAYRLGLIALDLQDIDDARRRFEEVEALLPRSKLARSAGRHLTRLARQTPRDWELWATLGGGYDSNVTLADEDELVGLRGGESSAFAVTELGGTYEFLVTDDYRVRVGQRGWLSFQEDETDLNLQINQSWATATASLSDWASADLSYIFEYIWLDWDAYRRTHAVEPALEFQPYQDLMVRAFFRYEDRGYFLADQGPAFDRDGQVRTSGLELQYVLPEFVPWVRAWLRMGYRYRDESTTGDQYDAEGHGPIATLGLWLPGKILLTLDGDYERRRYDSTSLLGPSQGRRFDRIRSFEAVVSRVFGRKMNLELGYLHTNRGSNVDPYAYRRNRAQLLATYRY